MERRTLEQAILAASETAKVATQPLSSDTELEVTAAKEAKVSMAEHGAEIVALHLLEGGVPTREAVSTKVEAVTYAGPAKTIGEQTSRAIRVLCGFPATKTKAAKPKSPESDSLIQLWSEREFDTTLHGAYTATIKAETTPEQRLLKAVQGALTKFAKEENTSENYGVQVVVDWIDATFSALDSVAGNEVEEEVEELVEA